MALRSSNGHIRVVVLPERIELSTSSLPMTCSTTELRQLTVSPRSRAPWTVLPIPSVGCRISLHYNGSRCGVTPSAVLCRSVQAVSGALLAHLCATGCA